MENLIIKNTNMEYFKVNKVYSIACEWKKTRQAFKHEATLLKNGWEHIAKVKICYQNRTWERFTYESVMSKLIDQTGILTKEQKRQWLEHRGNEEIKEFKKSIALIGAIAQIGSVLTKDKKEANDFKARILKAGLEGKGLIMPEDWDTLSEDEKTRRLDGAIAQLQ